MPKHQFIFSLLPLECTCHLAHILSREPAACLLNNHHVLEIEKKKRVRRYLGTYLSNSGPCVLLAELQTLALGWTLGRKLRGNAKRLDSQPFFVSLARSTAHPHRAARQAERGQPKALAPKAP